MIKGRVKTFLTFCSVSAVFAAILSGLVLFTYLKVLPWAVSNPKAAAYLKEIASKAYYVDIDIENPSLKTELSPVVGLSVDKLTVKSNNQRIFDVENFATSLSFSEIFQKKVILKDANVKYIFADTSKILALPVFKTQTDKQVKSDWNVDIFHSVLGVKQSEILYDIDKNTKVKVNAKNITIDDNPDKKKVTYDVGVDISKNKNKLHIQTTDGGNVFIENQEKISVKNSTVRVNDSTVLLSAVVDDKANYDVNLSGKKFAIPAVLELLDSQIVENNLTEQLIYFKDISGDFDFNIKANNKAMNGTVDLNKLSFKLIPLADLPILLNRGKVSFDDKKIYLKEFKGYYNNKPSNTMDFEGTVDDYMKSVDTDLVGNALVTNDFAKNCLSKMIGYPIGIEGKAETKVKLKSKYNKIDLKWLFWFKKGNGFIVDGEESFMNDEASRVLSAVMHFEDTMLNLKSMNYYAGNPEDDMTQVKIPIVSVRGDIDFANGETFVKRMGMELPKPMPSAFINMLIKQKLFKNGTFTGKIDVLNKKGCPPKVKADMKVQDLRIPSQRLFIKNGEFKTDRDNMHIKSDGRYRRSAYNLSGTIVNEIKFPIIVKNITLDVDNIDVERYLKAFNAQQPTEAAQDVSAAVAKSVSQNGDVDDDDDDVQTFDLANLIIEECILKVKKGFYKDIHFSDVAAKMTLDKNSLLKITSNRFDIAEGTSSAKINCDLKNHKYDIWLGIKEVNSDIMATSLLNLSKEIQGKASGLIELNTDDSLKLNGRIQFRVYKGIIGKVGLIEYVMKVASLFRNPLTMVSPSTVSDLVNVPEGKFDQIDGDLILKDNIVMPMKIKSFAPQLSSYIVGTYNLENQDAALRIYTKFSNRRKGLYGVFRNISLNSLANRIPLSSRNDSDYYEAEISQLPEIDADEKDCQIFLTKVDGDVEHNNFISSLKKIK